VTEAIDPNLKPGRRSRDLSRGRRRRLLAAAIARTVITVVVLVVGYHLVPFDRGDTWQIGLVAVVALVLLFAGAVLELRAVKVAEFPTLRAVQSLTVSLVVVLLSFAGVYMILSNNDSGAFDEVLDHTGAVYFSLTTLTTIGYGDIVPLSHAARNVVMLQMVIDVLIIGVYVKLVTTTVRERLAAAPASSVD
jgi:voltage-gated potassium channel